LGNWPVPCRILSYVHEWLAVKDVTVYFWRVWHILFCTVLSIGCTKIVHPHYGIHHRSEGEAEAATEEEDHREEDSQNCRKYKIMVAQTKSTTVKRA
jgi:hypothetical protein